MLAAWHASMEVGMPLANKDFLVGAFKSLGDNRREALKIAAGLRGEDAFNAGVAEEQALESVLPWLSRERATELLAECIELYVLGPARRRELARRSPRSPARCRGSGWRACPRRARAGG